MYTNVVFETDESVLFIEVFLIQRCPYREVPLYIHVNIAHDVLNQISPFKHYP